MAIIRDLPIADYFASDAVSHSKLKDFARSPRLYLDKWVDKVLPGYDDSEESAALTFGKAFEALLCDDMSIFPIGLVSPAATQVAPGFQVTQASPSTALAIRRRSQFDAEFTVKPEGKAGDGRTVEGKEWARANAHRSVITARQRADAGHMVASIAEHAVGKAMMRECEQQVTFRRQIGGVLLQSRPDFVCLRGSAISGYAPYTLDLKTTTDLDRILSGRAIAEFGYHRQAEIGSICMAEHVQEKPLHFLAVIEKSLPFRFAVVPLDEYLPDAHVWVMSRLQQLDQCMQTQQWPRSREGITPLPKPRWLQEEEWAA